MILDLTLDNFKSFFGVDDSSSLRGPTIRFGGFSLIIGANASGKSNLRDGLRFIHAVSRGYTLPEIFGGKYGEGGELQWKGIRGGVREAVTRNSNSGEDKFTINVRTRFEDEAGVGTADYTITVDIGGRSWPPSVFHESLILSRRSTASFETGQVDDIAPGVIEIRLREASGRTPGLVLGLPSDRPAITQLPENDNCPEELKKDCKAFLRTSSQRSVLTGRSSCN